MPRSCKDLTSNGKSKGVCMFNYECTQKGGQVVGSCMDGFLFGACCKLPPGSVFHSVEIPSSSPSTTSLKPLDHNTLSSKPITLHPVGETILLHKNGSVVIDKNDPEEFSLLKKPQENSSALEVSTSGYITDPSNYLPAHNNVFTKNDDDSSYWTTNHSNNSSSDTQSMSKTTQGMDFEAVTPLMQGTTRHDEENFHSTTIQNVITNSIHLTFDKYHSTTKLPSYVYYTKPSPTKPPNKHGSVTNPISYTSSNQPLKPKPISPDFVTQTTTEKSYPSSVTFEDNMLPIVTINNKPSIEDATNSASINHILHLLNDSEPSPEPISTNAPSLSTWVSIDGKPEKTGSSPNLYTTPHYYQYDISDSAGSTTVQNIQGPSFQVTPQIKDTAKPGESTTPEPPPTVIVLGPFNTFSSVKPQVTSSYNNPKPSQTVTVLSPFPHSTVVTVKPGGSVISVKPPHSTYHNPWTSASPLVSVTHPSSSGSHQVTTPVHLITKPPKPHPSVYTSGKPVTYTTIRPITYTSQKPTNQISEKPVIITSSKPGYPVNENKPSFPTTQSALNVPLHSEVRPPYGTAKPQFVDKYGSSVSAVKPSTEPTNASTLLVAFPPVRDPNISQSEKPTLTTLSDEEQSTVNLVEDDNLNDKIHGFVEKIVQSLEGNFVDLENVLLDGQTKLNSTLTQKPLKRPSTVSSASTKPTKKPPTKPTTTTQKPLVSITKPTSVRPEVSVYTNRPATVQIPTNQKPGDDTETNIPTKRPTTAPTLVLFQPSSTTTKRPIPTTVVLDNISIVEEQTQATPPKPSPEVNFKKGE